MEKNSLLKGLTSFCVLFVHLEVAFGRFLERKSWIYASLQIFCSRVCMQLVGAAYLDQKDGSYYTRRFIFIDVVLQSFIAFPQKSRLNVF